MSGIDAGVPVRPIAVGVFESLRRLLPGVWLGALLMVALVMAPLLFGVLDRPLAGRVAARLFAIDAPITLAFSVVLAVLERHRAARRAATGEGSQFSPELVLVLGALFCTVLGYYALQPMLASARAGTGPMQFAVLHGISTVFYGLKTVCVAALALRVARA